MPHETLTDSQSIVRVTRDVLRARKSNGTATKKEHLLARLTRERSVSELGAQVLALLEECTTELGKDERGLVHLGVIVARARDLAQGLGEVTTGLLRGDHEADLAGGVGGDRRVRVLGDGEEAARSREEVGDEVEVDPQALALGGDVSPGGERVAEELEVRLLEEGRSGPDGVRGVRDDHVVRGRVVREEPEAVADEDGHARVAEERGHVREELLRDADDRLVDVAEDDLLHGGVLEHLADDAAVAAADDEHLLRVWVARERDVGDHLLVGELIALGALDDAVEDEDVAVRLGLEDEHVLVEGLLDVEDFVDLEGHGLARPLRGDLAEPAVCEG